MYSTSGSQGQRCRSNRHSLLLVTGMRQTLCSIRCVCGDAPPQGRTVHMQVRGCDISWESPRDSYAAAMETLQLSSAPRPAQRPLGHTPTAPAVALKYKRNPNAFQRSFRGELPSVLLVASSKSWTFLVTLSSSGESPAMGSGPGLVADPWRCVCRADTCCPWAPAEGTRAA